MEITTSSRAINMRPILGRTGPAGQDGIDGKDGLPGVNAVPAVEATAAYIRDDTEATAALREVVAADVADPASEVGAALSATLAMVGTAAQATNSDNAAAFARVASAFMRAPAGLFLARKGNDYTFLRGLGGGRFEAFTLPRVSQSLNGVTYTLNNLRDVGIAVPMLSVDDGAATYGGSWAHQTQIDPTLGFLRKDITVSTTSGSGTITVTSGTVDATDVGKRVRIPGAAAGGGVLESTIGSVNTGAGTFAIGTAASATLSGVAAVVVAAYRYNATAGATATWTSPTGTTALALRILTAVNGGLGRVSVDGSATAANLLPTAQQLVSAGRYPNTILVANGGTLNPTDRVLDFWSGQANTFNDQRRPIADGLTAGTHEVVVTVTGYQPTGGSGARVYIDGWAWATAATTPTTAAAEMFMTFDVSSGFNSAWEYAIDCRPATDGVGSGTWHFVGQNAHQLEEQTGLTVYLDDLPATPADGSITSARSVTIVRTTKLLHPDTGAALTATPWATATVTYRLDRNGLSVTPRITLTREMEVRTAYSMMPLAGPDAIGAKIDRAALSAAPQVYSMTSSGQRVGTTRSAHGWAWDSTGKVGAAVFIPDHYGFTEGYTRSLVGSQIEDRSALPHTTKFYLPWIGPDLPRLLPAGTVKQWTTRHVVGYFEDANAALAAL